MSGIVRGFASESEMIHVRETQLNCPEDVALLGVRSIANDTRKIPVAVVPLDDATLAAMAERFLDVFESESKLHAMRAALGLGGEPTSNNQQGSHT